MHELSIVANIMDIVEEYAVKQHAITVHEIELDIGQLAGIDFDALEFAISHAPRKDLLRNAAFIIHKIDPAAKCRDCQHTYPTKEYATPCPGCGSIRTTITTGNELKVRSFKID